MIALAAVVLFSAAWYTAGWYALTRLIRYPLPALRREMAMNGISFPMDDGFYTGLLRLVYAFLLTTWPLAVHRKRHLGRVVGK